MSDLAAALADLLAADFAASPVLASSVGLTEFDDRLDDLSAEAFERRDATAGDAPRPPGRDRPPTASPPTRRSTATSPARSCAVG